MDRDPPDGFSLRTYLLANRVQWLVFLAVIVPAIILEQWWLAVVAIGLFLLTTQLLIDYRRPWWAPEVKAWVDDPVARKASRRGEVTFFVGTVAVGFVAIVVGTYLKTAP